MKTSPIKAGYYLLKSNLEVKYRILPESVYMKIHLPPYIEDGKAKYRPYRFPVCRILPKYFGNAEFKYKYDIITVIKNREHNRHFINAQNDIEDALIKIKAKYGYLLPSNEVLIEEINDLLRPNIKPRDISSLQTDKNTAELDHEDSKQLCLLSEVQKHYDKIIAISKENRTDAVSENTIIAYKSLKLNIEKYYLEHGTVNLLEFTNEKWDEMWNVIATYKRGPDNYKYKTVQLRQGQLRHILSKLPIKNLPLLNLNDDLINKNIDPVNAHTELFLTEDKLKLLIKSSFKDKKMEYARKYLIIASLTGQRYQSMKYMSNCAIEWNDEYKFYYAHFIQEKTGTHCYCPLFKEVINLCPPGLFLDVSISNQKIRDWIDKVVIKLDIKRNVNVTTHTCRKTFVSLLKPYRVKDEIISFVTHPTEKYSKNSIAHYDKSNLIYKAEEFFEATKTIKDRYPFTVFQY